MPVSFEDYARARLGPLLRTATAISGDPYLAEEIVQDVFIKVARHWAAIGPREHRDAYVRRMVVNELVSWRRKWSRLIPSPSVIIETVEPDPAARVADRDLLDRELQQLPTRQRIVLVLRYLEGLGDADIAAAMGCAESSVRSFAARGLASLRIQLRVEEIAAPICPSPYGGSR